MILIIWLIIILVICALVSAIWGRGAGQKLFGCIGWTVFGLIVVGVWFCLWLGNQTENYASSQQSNSASTTATTSAPYVQPTSPTNYGSPLHVGLTQQKLDPFSAGKLRLPPGSGIYVVSVDGESRAESAGVKKGDVITMIDNQIAGLSSDYPRDVAMARDEDASRGQMMLTIYRRSTYLTITIPLN
jgi:hypothetical protein